MLGVLLETASAESESTTLLADSARLYSARLYSARRNQSSQESASRARLDGVRWGPLMGRLVWVRGIVQLGRFPSLDAIFFRPTFHRVGVSAVFGHSHLEDICKVIVRVTMRVAMRVHTFPERILCFPERIKCSLHVKHYGGYMCQMLWLAVAEIFDPRRIFHSRFTRSRIHPLHAVSGALAWSPGLIYIVYILWLWFVMIHRFCKFCDEDLWGFVYSVMTICKVLQVW